MTTEEIEALQMGDIIQFPDLKYAEVKSTNNIDKIIDLRMLSGDETMAAGDLPPELVNVETLCVCAWADLSAAEFISNAAPLVQGAVSSPKIAKIDPFVPEIFFRTLDYVPEIREKLARLRQRPATEELATFALEPEATAAPQVAPRADGDLSPVGTVIMVPVGTPAESLPPPTP